MNKKVFLPSILLTGLLLSSTVHAAEPDNNTVDGTATYFSTGEIVPSKVQFTGYDVRNKNMYVNLALTSDESTPTDRTDSGLSPVPYTIDVFSNSANTSLLPDSYEHFTESMTPDGKPSSIEVSLGTPLPKDYRIVVEVDRDRAEGVAE